MPEGGSYWTAWTSLRMQLDAHRPDRARSTALGERPAIPVTLLTGFLGAGKSTLLAGLLSLPPDGLIVRAVVNDVGSLGFDPTLVGDGVEVELTNGCGCCEATDGLAAALARTAALGPDLIVLEASGVADPLAVAQVVEADAGLRLDRIVAAVDSTAVDSTAVDSILDRQLDAAHCVVVTNSDRVDDIERARVEALVAERVPGRVIALSRPDALAIELLTPLGRRGRSADAGAGDGRARAGDYHRRRPPTAVDRRGVTAGRRSDPRRRPSQGPAPGRGRVLCRAAADDQLRFGRVRRTRAGRGHRRRIRSWTAQMTSPTMRSNWPS